MIKRAIFLALATVLASSAAAQQNVLVNGDFETNPPSQNGNNVGYSIAPWVLGSGNQSNVVQVDGPGGYNYGASGPESDASAPGASIPQHYLDIADGDNDFYQSFTPRCPGNVVFGGSFSTRADSPGTASVAIRQGTGTSGTLVGSTNTISLPGGSSKTDPWTPVSFTVTITAGVTYSFIVAMDNNMNFDNGFVRYEVDCGGQLKVCKVAGPGVAVGTPFTFTAGTAPPFTAPAGPPSGGTCVLGPIFPVGSTIAVTETLSNGNQVTDIQVAPASQLAGIPDLAGGSVNVTIGSGVTEVTFTNERTGFLEICKRVGHLVPGTPYTFYLNNGALGPFTVPAGSCSPAIEVPAGTVTIHEVVLPGTHLASCSTIPAGNQISCNPQNGTSTVNVNPGDVSAQTIAFLTNLPNRRHIEESEDPTSSSDQQH